MDVAEDPKPQRMRLGLSKKEVLRAQRVAEGIARSEPHFRFRNPLSFYRDALSFTR
jgi:hypothetical protein